MLCPQSILGAVREEPQRAQRSTSTRADSPVPPLPIRRHPMRTRSASLTISVPLCAEQAAPDTRSATAVSAAI